MAQSRGDAFAELALATDDDLLASEFGGPVGDFGEVAPDRFGDQARVGREILIVNDIAGE